MTVRQNYRLRRMLGISYLFLLILLFLASSQVQATLTARLDREHISAGESVRLLVEVDGQNPVRPDTSPLEQDFEILSVSSGSQINFINGRMDASTNWTITLSPKRSGRLIIPALELNGEQSRPLSLLVSETPTATGSAGGKPIFIETEVDRKDPYVQGMVRYTIRLLHEIKLLEGSLSEPRLDNALVHRLGKDREYTTERDGRRYRVIERRFAIFPQASGELTLPAPILNASVPDKTRKQRSPFQDFFGRDPFADPFFGGSGLGDMFTSSQPVRVRGEAQTLQVRPRPAQTMSGHWLPAESLVLNENWQPQADEMRVGDPLTRTLSIQAQGITGEQLPELEPGSVAGFKVYPDLAQVSTEELERTVQGAMTRSIAFVPVRPGIYNLPSVQLHWWDTNNDQARVVKLPERTIKVLPALAGSGAAVLPSATETTLETIESQANTTPELAQTLPSGDRNEVAFMLPNHAGIWPWLSLLFGLLWLVTLGIWWRGRQQSAFQFQTQPGQQGTNKEKLSKSKAGFLAACRANDASLARHHLLDWTRHHWPDAPPKGLDELAQRFTDPHARQTLAELDRILYRGGADTWDGRALAKTISKLPKQLRAPVGKKRLPDLYAS